jgi:hypothetical protein
VQQSKTLELAEQYLRQNPDEALEEDIQISMRDRLTNRVRSSTPREETPGGKPLLVIVYGWGY